MLGTGNLSLSVASLRQRKSPHGCHDPSSLGTMWSGDDQALFDRRTTPALDMSSKAALAAASLSGGRGLAFANTGLTVMGICRTTPCFAVGSENFGTRISR